MAILALVLVGFFGARRGLLTPGFSKKVSSLVMNVFLPASVFLSITDGVGQIDARELPHIVLMLTLLIAVSYIVAFLFARLMGRRTEDPATLELSVSAMNTLLVGLPIVQGVYGSLGVLYTGLSNLPFNLALYTYGVWRLGSTGPNGHGGLRLRDMFTVVLIGTLIALGIFCLGLPVPGIFRRFLSIASGATTPMSMVVIGVTMGSEDIRTALKDKRVYAVCLLRLVLIPLLVWLMMRGLTANALLLKTCVVLAACPTGIIVPIISLQYGHDPTLASNSVIVSTLLSLLALPAIIFLLG